MPAAPQHAAHARLGGLGGGCWRAGLRRRCPAAFLSIAAVCTRQGMRRGRPGRGCEGGGGLAGGPRPERCLGTENGSVRRHTR
jgi:hypothetical protein